MLLRHFVGPFQSSASVYLTRRLPKRLGAPVEAKVMEPVFAFDREVVPVGTIALGYWIDQDPGAAIWVSATEKLIRDYSKDTLFPILKNISGISEDDLNDRNKSSMFEIRLPSMTLLLAAILVFVMALVLLGYTFSSFARTQMQAMQLTFFFFLPSILLSGFMFPFHGMPDWAQDVGQIFPLTHFLRVVRAVMLKGANLGEVGFEMSILWLFVAVYAFLALTRFRRTLD